MNVTILERPSFHTDYRKTWLYCTTSIAAYQFHGVKLPRGDIYHQNRLLASVIGNTLTIYKGYAFDGMTNWPDDSANLPCALLHDFLYQTSLLTRRDADKALKAVMKSNGARYRRTVFAGVRLFGWLHFGEESQIRIVKQ